MKYINFIVIIIISLTGMNCKAQNSIVNIEDRDGTRSVNTYYSDTNNLLDPFVGTWVWDDGTHYLKIIFQKKTMEQTGNYYQDLLIGEFQYKLNGTELINTLPNLTAILTNVYHHSIDGNYILTRQTPFDDYTTNNFRVNLGMVEPNGSSCQLDVRVATFNGQEAIQIFKRSGIVTVVYGQPAPEEPIIPNGFYFLIKQ